MVRFSTIAAALLAVILQVLPAVARGGTQGPVPAPPLGEAELAAGWIALFDGQTLFGWRPNSDLNWSVRDGAIRADRGKPGLLLTTFRLADYELRCEYLLEKGGNSGLFLRTPFFPKDPKKDCYELNMCDSHPAFPTGSIVGRMRASGTFRGEGTWMTMEVRVEGRRIAPRLNGTPVVDFTDPSNQALTVGHIGLQMNGGSVAFRNIAVRPLGTKNLFDGRDLDGWHVVPGSKTRFDAEAGTIHAAGGPGFLESNETFADFVLQFDAKTNGTHLNSGIFFRAMRGTAKAPSNGYELQIQNGFRHGDRGDPVDAGTGAIYRRTKARWVIPDDHAWFTGTLIANKAHFSVWINGVQVTDWTDGRHDDPNPPADFGWKQATSVCKVTTARPISIFGGCGPRPFRPCRIPKTSPLARTTAMRTFKSLSEQEILALAVSLEEEDARIYDDFAQRLKGDYPATAQLLEGMRGEEDGHRHRLIELHRAQFGDHIPLIRRHDVKGFVQRRPIWLASNLRIETVRKQVELMELETKQFYERAIQQSTDAGVRQLFGDLAEEERKHARLAEEMGTTQEASGALKEEEATRHRLFVLQVVQPGLAGLMDGSVSTLAPLFAAAFATHNTWSTFLVGLAAAVGAGISMGFAEALSDDGSLTGRGQPWIRGFVCGLMTALGGLGHTLPFLIPHFWTATGVAGAVVAFELGVISWIRNHYMDTPLVAAVFQVVVGGVLVFLAGILIGSS